ncbi:transcriptional regulator family: Fungal Specific TF [Aspergillus niger]|nr:transcriptional regulator family: Fungal Specific TF [Aspergillus niger]KAI2840337.1 transcriptional regulator family: Fungal Specific TF [Aspergillus niger]KAI2879005.1 transcriptional regulator family: Fungal Specific TF [Aspergillus niger]KAI2998594.1 transcriptional regulator family: Fungal Specific TF [Aspergillus niger]
MTEKTAASTGPGPDQQTSNGTADRTKPDVTEEEQTGADASAKDNSQNTPSLKADGAAAGAHSSPKKRRKVNHACVYCRRSHMTCDSERPCTRCIKRNIGHLCHDEPREPSKRSRSENDHSAADDEGSSNNEYSGVQMPRNVDGPDAAGQQIIPDGTIGLPTSSVTSVQQPGNMASSGQGLNAQQQMIGYNEWIGGQSQFQDMHTFHPSYMFNAPEVTNEYNLLGDFLSNSLLDDGGVFQNDELQGIYSDPSLLNSMATLGNSNQSLLQQSQPAQPQPNQQAQGEPLQGPTPAVSNDKARETYYMTAADPSGSDPPEERMNKLLKAKYDAGLLRPFNYVKGYARLNQYMERHLQQASRQKILRQLDKFRPKFRERMQSLTDIELILVEMWFERSLMEYDRVFASMAIPACCWRRTGEIFRGNKEMAELIGVPIETLRDGKLAIHEIIVEDQLVSYWEKFGAIAFDNTQKAMLTSCTLKNPNSNSPGDGIPCCFSFTIRRDTHNIPSLIIGNFLPIVKAFAYAMLDYAAPYQGQGSNRALEAAFSIAMTCIDNDCLSLSQKIIEVAAVRLDKLERYESDVENSKLQQYTIEYYMIRAHLAWLQGRLDIAEHLFSKIPVSDNGRGQERVMDICYKIGNCAISHKQYDVSMKWLERALRAFRAGLHLDPEEHSGFLSEALDALKFRYGGMFPVQVIQLEMLDKEGADEIVFSQVLQSTIESPELKDSHLAIIMYYIQKLFNTSPEVSISMLKQLLEQVILLPNNEISLEKVFIAFVYVLTRSEKCARTSFEIFQETITSLKRHYKQPLSKAATEATLILIWKHVNNAISNDDKSVAGQWCLCLFEEPMVQISAANKAKLFRLSLQNSDPTASSIYLESLLKDVKAIPYLLSCIGEAFRLGKTQQGLESFEQVLKSVKWTASEGCHVAKLLQYG